MLAPSNICFINNRLTNLEQETANAFEKFETNRYWH